MQGKLNYTYYYIVTPHSKKKGKLTNRIIQQYWNNMKQLYKSAYYL